MYYSTGYSCKSSLSRQVSRVSAAKPRRKPGGLQVQAYSCRNPTRYGEGRDTLLVRYTLFTVRLSHVHRCCSVLVRWSCGAPDPGTSLWGFALRPRGPPRGATHASPSALFRTIIRRERVVHGRVQARSSSVLASTSLSHAVRSDLIPDHRGPHSTQQSVGVKMCHDSRHDEADGHNHGTGSGEGEVRSAKACMSRRDGCPTNPQRGRDPARPRGTS